MKKTIYLIIALVQWTTLACYAQRNQGWPDLNLDRAWYEYRFHAKYSPSALKWRFFRDTVSVEEMKTAFLKYKNVPLHKSPYAGFDTILTSKGKAIILRSPMRDVPLKDILAKPKLRKKLTGDVVYLAQPHPYMGFIVSPYAFYEVYQDGKLVGQDGKNHDGGADFFSYAQQATSTLHGEWNDSIESGARLMGAMIGLSEGIQPGRPERIFSVLLHRKAEQKYPTREEYTIDLLAPENPDQQTLTDFLVMKTYIEKLHYNTFKPYYTTDFRFLLGRYYRVTVNRCGWLVEDYMDINH